MNSTPETLQLDYTLFCEDVRVEASNHLSLMGVFHQIVVPQLPVGLIKLAVVNHWRGEGTFLAEVRILSPSRAQAVAVSQPSSFTLPADGSADNVTFFVNTNFFESGEHIVQMLIDSTLFAERRLPILIAGQQAVTESERVN